MLKAVNFKRVREPFERFAFEKTNQYEKAEKQQN